MPSAVRPLVLAWIALLVLLALTMTVARFDLGILNIVANLGIGAIKAGIVLWFFMHLRENPTVVRAFAFAGFLWLMILFTLGMADWLTRLD